MRITCRNTRPRRHGSPLFSRGNYLKRKKQLSKALLAADFTITDRRYIGHEDDTGYHHYAIDVAKLYRLEE